MPQGAAVEPTVNADGIVVCPDCGEEVSVGNGGIENFKKRHRGKKKCRERRAEKEAEARRRLGPKITNWLVPSAKQKRVQPTVSSPPPVTSRITLDTDLPGPSSTCRSESPFVDIESVDARPASPAIPSPPPSDRTARQEPLADALLRRLKAAIDELPSCVPEAKAADRISSFATTAIPLGLAPDEAWEALDPVLNRFLGYDVTAEGLAAEVRRGEKGMSAFWRYLNSWVTEYNIDGALLEGKVNKLISAIKIVYVLVSYALFIC